MGKSNMRAVLYRMRRTSGYKASKGDRQLMLCSSDVCSGPEEMTEEAQ